MNERRVRILSGLIAMLLFLGVTVFGVYLGAGKLGPKYHLSGVFSAAGQGLLPQSDVKIHGINVGHVTSVKLSNGRAKVGMAINTKQKIPVDSSAIIRPKTLFGEKFVDIDPGPNEASGPFLRNHGVIEKTVGGFELERVLSDLYPILTAIKPEELTVVLDTLAQGGQGLGPEINRQIVNFKKVSDVQAAHAADTQQFLDDLAKLSDELANRAGDVVAGAKDLNVALPTLNAHAGDLTTVLDQGARLASDLADVLENNRPFLRKNITEGGKTIQLLYDKRGQLPGVIRGLSEFFQVLGEIADRIPNPQAPGTTLAAVKFVVGGGPVCGRGVPCVGAAAAAGGAGAAGAPGSPSRVPSRPTSGAEGIQQLMGGLLK